MLRCGALVASAATATAFYPSPPGPPGSRTPRPHSPYTPSVTPPPTPAGKQQIVTFHVLDPAWTGIANKNTGDYLGDVDFILSTFRGRSSEAPDTSVLEQVLVQVDGNWTTYAKCNVYDITELPGNILPGDDNAYVCGTGSGCMKPASCTPTTDGRVGVEYAPPISGKSAHNGGIWLSFPKVGEGEHWTQVEIQRRITTRCLAEGWRTAAGGCPDCGDDLDDCVGTCVKGLNATTLKNVWDTVLANATLCPDQPKPAHVTPVPPTPGSKQ